MKTIAKTLIAVSILALSLQAYAGNEKPSGTSTSNIVTYKVWVHVENDSPASLGDVSVVITDETGRIVAPPQKLASGTYLYNFRETGSVKGTRIAKLVKGIQSETFLSPPDNKSGQFLGGNIYLFNLYVVFQNCDPMPGIE